MKQCTTLAMAVTISVLCGGCAVYSTQAFGPAEVTGNNLNEIIAKNGTPDSIDAIGDNTDLIMLSYNRVEAAHVLGLFTSVEKTRTAIVLDPTGRVISRGTSGPDKAVTILGLFRPSAGVVEDN